MVLSQKSEAEKSIGGVDAVCQELLKEIVAQKDTQRDYLVLGFSPSYMPGLDGQEETVGPHVTLRRYNYFKNKSKLWMKLIPNFIWQNLIIKKEVERFRPDLLHCHLYSWLLFRYKNIKTVLTLHSYKKIARDPVNFANDILYTKIITFIGLRNANCVTTVSKEILEKVRTFKKGAKYIPNPLNKYFFSVQRAKENLYKDPSLIITGSVEPRKRVLDALAIVNILKNKYSTVKLYIAGLHNIHTQYFKVLSGFIEENNLNKNVVFLGSLTVAELCEYYSKVHLGLFLSENETFGLAPLEMMAAGLPTVFTKVGAAKWYEKEFAQIGLSGVEPRDVETSIKLCFDILETKRLSDDRARNFISKTLSSDKILSEYYWIYDNEKV